MEYLVGVGLALAVSIFATVSGFERDRAFYPTCLIVIAALYDLFAVMGGSSHALAVESLVFGVFLLAAVLGFKLNLWIVAGGLVAHGVLDSFHGALVSNPGVPRWWPGFCLSYDVVAGAYLAVRLKQSGIRARATR